MKIVYRDKRALIALFLVICGVGLSKVPRSFDTSPAETNLNRTEVRLDKLQAIAAGLPMAKTSNRQAKATLASREAGLIDASDDKLAQEKLLNILEKLAQAQSPPLAIHAKELGRSRAIGNYGKVSVTIVTSCRIEQLVNFVSDLSAQPEAVATEELHIYGVNPESKQMQVRLTIGGLVSAKLLPKSKDLNEF